MSDGGISLVQNQMIAALRNGQAVGGVAEDEFDVDGGLIPGFTTSAPTAASLTEEERNNRQLKRLTFTARLSGAIHFAEIKGSLSYKL